MLTPRQAGLSRLLACNHAMAIGSAGVGWEDEGKARAEGSNEE